MKKLALGALLGGAFALAACGGGGGGTIHTDGSNSGSNLEVEEACNPVAQTGCDSGQKCAWIVDQAGSNGADDLAHIGCTADGTAALGAACTGGPGTVGADNCVHGTACLNDHCEEICDPSANNGCSDGSDCSIYSNFYQVGSDNVAGVCEPTCDVLTQHQGDFGSSSGSNCPSNSHGAEACYGAPFRNGSFTCAPAGGSAATDGIKPTEVDSNGDAYLNSCAPGNQTAFIFTINGAMEELCQGFCKPTDTYSGVSPAPAVTTGLAPYTCTRSAGSAGDGPQDVGGMSGDNCIYSWSLGDGTATTEYDPTTDTVASLRPWSDNLGLCFNYPAYDKFDPTDPNNGTNATEPFPNCKDMPIVATNDGTGCSSGSPCTGASGSALFGAADLGCVSFETAVAHPDPSLKAGQKHHSPLADVRLGYGKLSWHPQH